ncbi:MAG: hypothetical protein ACPHER_09265 [Nevskiales bacterium]
MSLATVNSELRPLARMTAPTEWQQRPIMQWPAQQRLFKSWILLLGILPIDRHHFYFEWFDPEQGFCERSASSSNSLWRHQRRVTASAAGCVVTDSLQYQNRLPLCGAILKPVYQMVFWHRHRKLRARYGGRAL